MKKRSAKFKRAQVKRSVAGNAPKKRRQSTRGRVQTDGATARMDLGVWASLVEKLPKLFGGTQHGTKVATE